jgi:hypothetical protein
MINKKCIWTINYDSLNKNTISLKLHNRTEKNHNHRIQLSSCLNSFSIWDLLNLMNAIRIVNNIVYKKCTSIVIFPPKSWILWLWFFSVILLTIRIAFIKFKRSHIENEFRQLDKFTLNLSIFFSEMVSLQSPF